MKNLWLFCLLASLPAFGQAYSNSVTQNSPGNYGRPVPYATVLVCASTDTAVPCTQKVPTYTNDTLVTACTSNASSGVLTGGPTSGTKCNNPGLADANGNFTLFLPSGSYMLCTYAQGWLCQEISIGGGGLAPPLKIANCTAAGTFVNETVQLSTQVVNGVLSYCATVGALSSTSVIGICSTGCGTSGLASIAVTNFQNGLMDGAATQGDYVTPSASVVGFLSDAGAVRPPASVAETVGTVALANTGGAGTTANIFVAPLNILLPGGSGSPGTITPCSVNGCNAYMPTAGAPNVAGDNFFTDNGAGTFSAVAGNFTGPTNGAINLFGIGTPAAGPPTAAVQFTVPNSVTAYTNVFPGAAGTGCVQASNSSGTVTWSFTGVNCGTGSGATFQTNGVNNSSQSTLNLVNGSNITITNTSGGNVQISASGAGTTQIAPPIVPTVTPIGSTGATNYSYKVVGCEDGSTCAQNTPASNAGSTSTGNATLTSSNANVLTLYSVYGPRCYNVYRTVGGATQGKIATCVSPGGFTDTGLTGDGTTAPTSNNTTLIQTSNPSSGGCNYPSGSAQGTDGYPCSPLALNDEFKWTFGTPCDVNNPQWTCVNISSNGFAFTMTGGMLSMTGNDQGSVSSAKCMFQPMPSTPASFALLQWPTLSASSGNNWWGGLALRNSSTGKVEIGDFQILSAGLKYSVFQYGTSAAAGFSAQPLVLSVVPEPLATNFGVKDDGTNINFYASTDGVQYKKIYTETIASFFSTAPNQIGICFDGFAQPGIYDLSYFRQLGTQLP